MNMKYWRVSLLGLGILLVNACSTPQACDLRLDSVSVEIKGLHPEETVTIDLTTGDTVRHQQQFEANQIYFTILDDLDYQEELAGEVREFRFLGRVGDAWKISELYEIGADDCHVYYVSGTKEIGAD